MTHKDKRSIFQRKISATIRLVDLGIKVSCPGIVSEPLSYTLDRLKEFVDRRNADRYEEFHRKLLEQSDNEPAIPEAEIEVADYHALLNACLNDIEDEKTVAFATLTRSIALGRVPKDYRRHFILSLRDLSFDQMDYMRKLYVITKNRIPTSTGAGQLTVKTELSNLRVGSVTYLHFSALNSRGFIESEKLTDLGISFIESSTPHEYLEPGAYGYQVWSDYRCLIISTIYGDPIENSLIDVIGRALRFNLIESGGAVLRGGINERLSGGLLLANCGVLITDNDKELSEREVEHIDKISKKIPLVQMVKGDGLIIAPFGEVLTIRGETPTQDELDSLTRKLRKAANEFRRTP